MKKTLLLAVVLLISLISISCSDSDKLVGSWTLENNSFDGNKRQTFISQLQFGSDNYYTAVIAGERYHAKWRIISNQLELYSPEEEDSIIYDYSFETKYWQTRKLTIKGFIGGSYFSYSFTKDK